MSASVFTRRRSERLAQLIEDGSSRRRYARSHVRSGLDDELADMVSLSRRVRELPLTVQAHPEFREGLRAMLMATIDREGIGDTALRPEADPGSVPGRGLLGSRRARTRTAVIAGVAAGTLALSGMSAASGSAIPGSALYGVKRSAERAQLALAGSDVSRGELNFQFARTRLDEAAAFRNDPSRLAAVFDDMDNETRQGVRLLTTSSVEHHSSTELDAIDTFAASQRQALGTLRDGVTALGRARTDASLSLLTSVQQRSAGLRPILACGVAAASVADPLGPSPTAHCKTASQGVPGRTASTKSPAGSTKGGAGTGSGAGSTAGQAGQRTDQAGGGTPPASGAPAGRPGTSAAAVAPGTSPSPAADTNDDGGLLGGVGGPGGMLGD